MGLRQMFGQGFDSPGNQDDPYGLASSYDPNGDSDPVIQAHTAENLQMDPQSLYLKIQAQRAALNDQEKALLSRPAASSIPMSREQMLGAALQAALPVIAGYAGGGARGGAMGADYASQTVPELFKGFEGQNQDEANRKDKLDQFTILQKEKELAGEEAVASKMADRQQGQADKKDIMDYGQHIKEQAAAEKGGLNKDEFNIADKLMQSNAATSFSPYRQAMRQADAAMMDSSPGSATALIDAFGKMIGQPKNSLREAALRMAKDAASPYQKAAGIVSNILEGTGTLTDQTKVDLYREIANGYYSAKDIFNSSVGPLIQQATDAKMPMSHILGDLSDDISGLGNVDRRTARYVPNKGIYVKVGDGWAPLSTGGQ